jgi:TolB-like protein
MFNKNFYYSFFIFITVFFWLNPAGAKPVDQRASLALLPLEQIAEKDISPLRRGLKNMLISRLAKRAEIKIISLCLFCPLPRDSKVLAERIQELMKEYNTDYLLAGRLTEGKEYFVAETIIYAKGVTKPINTFSQEFANDDLVDAVDKISWNIAEKIFGSHKPAPQKKRKVSSPQPSAASTPEDLTPSFQSAHPDRILKKTVITGDLPELPPIKPYKSFALPKTDKQISPQVQQKKKTSPDLKEQKTSIPEETPDTAPIAIKTEELTETRITEKVDMAMQTMDMGDIDGDGLVDVVISEDNILAAYHLQGVNFQEFARQAKKAPGQIISVRLADINQNNREEIYVSCIVKGKAESFALEWDGDKFIYLFKDENWFVSPLNMPDQGIILAGQRSGKEQLFAPGIFRLKFLSQIIQQREKIIQDDTINLYNFALADLDGNGTNEIIVLTPNHTLEIKNDSGQLWQSSETYGDTITISINNEQFIEIPARIMIADINNDQLPDIIIKQNMATDSNETYEPDDFLRGSILAFSWNGSELNKIWQSEAVEGYISGYRFFPATGADPAQIYTGVVPHTSLFDFFSGQDSLILIYPVIFK